MSVRRRVSLGVVSGLAVVLFALTGGALMAAAAAPPLPAASAGAGTRVGVQVLPAPTSPAPTSAAPTPTSPPPTTAPGEPPGGPRALPTTGAPLSRLLVEVLGGLGAIVAGVLLMRLVSRRQRRPGN